MKLILFSTPICHLCSHAKTLINDYLASRDPAGELVIDIVDIINNADYLSRYGESIPVVKERESGAELYWPFDIDDFDRWLAKLKSC